MRLAARANPMLPVSALLVLALAGNTTLPASPPSAIAGESADLRALVEADWIRQETRRGRAPTDSAALRDAIARARRLIDALGALGTGGGFDLDARKLEALERRAAEPDAIEEDSRLSLYREIRWLARRAALRNPAVSGRPIAFLQRRRFICQMLHEYVGYFYDYRPTEGGGVRILTRPGESLETRDLVAGRLPRGNYATLAASWDGETLWFAFAERAVAKPDFRSRDRRCFHIYRVGKDGSGLRQMTDGRDDDFDPCPLPDGGVAFMSTRRGGFARCNNPWEPLPTHTLHRMDPGGGSIRALSFHETSEWHPSVLGDGRIIYTRWDYVDRSAANFHGLWISNPDGSGASALFGNYTERINACYQPRAVPGSRKIVFVAGAHHANVGGSLVLLDPARTSLDPRTGEDSLDAIEMLTPEVCFAEAPGWPGSWFHSPWPLSEDVYLVSFCYDPLPGMGPGVETDTETGIYYFDRFGNLEILFREQGISSMYPILLAPRSPPPTLASNLDPSLGDEAEVVLADVSRGHFPLPPSRPVRSLRIFQVLPKAPGHTANRPRIGHANAESARMLLGTVPVETDGSAYFRVPAGKPLLFQAVDGDGRAVQGMRSLAYFQPGERRSCVGCHEPREVVPQARSPLATRRGPSTIEPGPDGSRPWSFQRLVQPVIRERCDRCHDGSVAKPDLAALPEEDFTRAYRNLRPYLRWYEWGGDSIDGVTTRPGRMPTDESPLVEILKDSRHADIGLEDEEIRRLYLWLDGNAAFYGVYDDDGRVAQLRGETVAEPEVQ